ncbi:MULTISPECIES: DUF4388 domain-containing protein [Deinococcus]|uniref:DUF4388 domain-containing protein n=1 Tax=Deinococcus rufus TaxID=2136097 RepID=A0ABV7ZD44_9DEIO|nr:DUF4388 domain-containing protein [Deinococcus sp. AB2017081]WQE94157.1 DUF4388 domain-containing protein [Deinococcus sp. AB2017081]
MVRGDLSVFPFLSVMQMLLASGRVGRFSVDHPRGGQLWIDRGDVVHAATSVLKGEAALQLLSSLDAGLFTFEPDVQPPERTLNLRRDSALRRMIEESDGWTASLRTFPDWTRSLRFTDRWTEAQPVSRTQYRALSLLENNENIQVMLERSGEAPRAVLETLRPFLTAGLIEQV